MASRFPDHRRGARFHFDSPVRMKSSRLGREIQLWGRSTDLSAQGIGVAVAGELTTDELVGLQIHLSKAKIVTVNASVRYCKQGR